MNSIIFIIYLKINRIKCFDIVWKERRSLHVSVTMKELITFGSLYTTYTTAS